MTVYVNQKPYEVKEGISLADFMESTGIKLLGIAVAIDYEVIPKARWTEVLLTDGVELMLIHAVSGG
ncbi:sulfur carrier protein ThiS [Bacteroides sp. 519]|uniref:sulfur carrier protein ThiS n=1 Tax=Bacteroides sp. 519 TaxID=2302937 RepID=UPI0013D86FD3|nr:sulfur carrier protein ThiS [Bacteroides sp. 519]NDV59887.1 sulfur carrier protein ThiS [Bacteroides sp. 519]